MTGRAQAVLREAMTLPADERAEIAAELLASLDDSATEDPATIQAAWAREIEKRGRRVLAGESLGEPWDDVRDSVARSLDGLDGPADPDAGAAWDVEIERRIAAIEAGTVKLETWETVKRRIEQEILGR